jgi:hypothetical protein
MTITTWQRKVNWFVLKKESSNSHRNKKRQLCSALKARGILRFVTAQGFSNSLIWMISHCKYIPTLAEVIKSRNILPLRNVNTTVICADKKEYIKFRVREWPINPLEVLCTFLTTSFSSHMRHRNQFVSLRTQLLYHLCLVSL